MRGDRQMSSTHSQLYPKKPPPRSESEPTLGGLPLLPASTLMHSTHPSWSYLLRRTARWPQRCATSAG